ncbi:hypothetical protein NQ315_014422 [Exocentrus adspersus]|uniref:Nonsense-mediated mRNA decay factor SMG8 n=1 Tax=Exocentrus adspersus TaxID=1586481 RepID=A0AAV8VBX0_9CUCU|nr:hypothetical protein NQ315_014422 [Exocentrus adspersus]
MKYTFTLPNLEKLLNLQDAYNGRILIISLIGKSAYNLSGFKMASIGHTLPVEAHRDRELSECLIDGSYDEENQILYLYLSSLLDTDILIKEYKHLAERCEVERNCDDFLTVFDDVKSSFARYLLLLMHISHIIILVHPCSTFDTNYIQYFKAVDILSQKMFDKISESLKTVNNISSDWINNGRPCTPRLIFYFEHCPRNINNLKKLEHNLEDKIYHILKKTRIISTTGCSLFAIPLNDEFVYISEGEPSDKLFDAVKGFLLDCQPGGVTQIEAPYSNGPKSEKNFQRFLEVHIQQAKHKGFDDTVNSGRHQHSHPSHFELPSLKVWVEVVQNLYDLIMQNKILTPLCTDTRFSEQRCLKVLPLALARYQEGLPSHYAKSEHEARLSIALALFRAQARGPVFYQYASQLERECQGYWENGRQQCETASMTGNPCKLPKHSSDQEHISGFIYKAVCDCGRKVGPREDPYTAKQANYLFYQQISKECQCGKLERISFPIFQPSIQEYKAATLNETEDSLSVLSDKSGDLIPDVGRSLIRQPSTTEYLPGMLTLSSPPGLLPVYSSWSLVCLGASSLYSHNLGLSESHHPGFLSSTNYLLPWDVTVYSKSKQNWPNVSKYTVRGRRGVHSTGTLPQFTVKVFIGVEYECSSGHRFMLASPDRVLKATPGSIVKDTGHKVAESDMPLYYPCVCRAGKFAQLMRLHVVTPKAPVHCTLSPKVQPAPGAPIFVSTLNGPIQLTRSAYWILRLPYVYVGDKEYYNQNLSGKLLQGVFGVTESDQ